MRKLILPLLFLLTLTACTSHKEKAEKLDTSETAKYEAYMKHIYDIAAFGSEPYAAMLINDSTGEVISIATNNIEKSPSLHGEINLINTVKDYWPDIDFSKTTLITTAEPCPMCAGAIVWSGIPRVVYGTSIKQLLEFGLDQIEIPSEDIYNKSPFYQGKTYGNVLDSLTNKLYKGHVEKDW